MRKIYWENMSLLGRISYLSFHCQIYAQCALAVRSHGVLVEQRWRIDTATAAIGIGKFYRFAATWKIRGSYRRHLKDCNPM